VLTQITNAVRSRQSINPRTVLGFYATVLGILATAAVTGAAVLASADRETWLIPWLFGFSGAVLLLLLIGVFIVTLIDPSKLMLTQVSGTEYAAIQQQVVLGDSTSGERLVLEAATPGILEALPVQAIAGRPAEVPVEAPPSTDVPAEDGDK
jgi:hypothetical protein